MRSLKIVKSVILIVLMFSLLIGCSGIPDDIRKNLWEDSEEVVSQIDECYTNECNWDSVQETSRNFIKNYDKYESESEEDLSFEVWNLYTIYGDLRSSENLSYEAEVIYDNALSYERQYSIVSEILKLKNKYETEN